MVKKSFRKQMNFILILLLYFLIVSSLLTRVSSPVAADQQNIKDQEFGIDSAQIEFDEGIIKKENKIIVPSNTSLVIKNRQSQFSITLPRGSDVIDYNQDEFEVVHEDFQIETINVSQKSKIFIPFNYGVKIGGTKNFTFKIYINDNATDFKLDSFITHYRIDWGDNTNASGSLDFPPVITHIYNKPGRYNISIHLIDKNNVQYSLDNRYSFNLSTAQFVTFWTAENKEPLTIGTGGLIGSFIFFGIAMTETGRYKILALLAMLTPLIVHSNKEDVLDQFVRGQIYGYVKTNPGTHYNQIMKELDIKNGTLSYHLHVLEKAGIIKSRIEQFRYRAFYPSGMKFPEEERYRLTNLQIRILETIQKKKGISQKEIAKTLDETHQTISYNIKILDQSGLLSVYKKGRKSQIYLTDASQAIDVIDSSEKSVS